MMQHVLVSKGVWGIVQGIDVHLGSVDVGSVEDVASSSIGAARIAEQAWDILAGLYAGQNEAKISYLCKELESKIMQEDDDMNVFLVEIEDLKEQLMFAREVIPYHSLVQIVLDALPESYQTFASTWRLVTEDIPDAVRHYTLVSKLLQEVQPRQNKARQRVVDQAFVAAQHRRSGKNINSSNSSYTSKPTIVTSSTRSNNKSKKTGDKDNKKMRCNYCKSNDHVIKSCPKLKAKEASKKSQM
ncbi:hypothetical protein L7F22_042488 [Adiantum nelumboides]|nr:hypothetical protein [Adiantum nelumboides]